MHEPIQDPRTNGRDASSPQPIRLVDAARGSSALRLLLLAGFAASLGAYGLSTAESWIVLQITGTATSVGVITFLASLPWLFLSIRAGSIGDRRGPSAVLAGAQAFAAAGGLVLALLILAGNVVYWEVLLVALVSGIAGVLTSTAYLALLTGFASGGSVEAATGLNTLLGSVARIVAPFVAGALILGVGTGTTCLIAAWFLVLATWASLLLHRKRPAGSQRVEADRTRLESRRIRSVLSRRVATVFLSSAALSISATPAINIIAVLARDSGLGPIGLSAFSTSVGLGSALAVLIYVRIPSYHRQRSVISAIALVPIGLLSIGLAPTLIAVLPFAVLGGSQTVFGVYAISVIAEDVAASDRGRVLGLYLVAALGLSPFGNILAGVAADKFGSPTTFAALGVLGSILLLIIGGLSLSGRMSSAIQN